MNPLWEIAEEIVKALPDGYSWAETGISDSDDYEHVLAVMAILKEHKEKLHDALIDSLAGTNLR